MRTRTPHHDRRRPRHRRLGFAFAYGGALLTLPACHTPPHAVARVEAEQRWSNVRARVKLQLAEQQYRGRMFEEAVHTINEALALDPTLPDAYVLLARSHLELGQIASAERAVAGAAGADIASADLAYTHGVIYELRDQLPEALERFAEAHRQDPTQVDHLVAFAECLVALGRHDEAAALLDAGAESVNDDGTVALLAARVAALRNDGEAAIRQYRNALAASGGERRVAEELGLLLARAGRCEESITVLAPLVIPSEATVSDGGASWARPRYLADGEASRGGRSAPRPRRRGDGAEFTEVSAGDGAIRRTLARCYMAQDDAAQAREVLAEYVRIAPEDIQAQFLLAQAGIALSDFLTAGQAIEQLERSDRENPELPWLLAVFDWRRGDAAAAGARLEALVRQRPVDAGALCLLGDVLRGQGRRAEARAYYQRALRVDTNCGWALAGLKLTG